MSMRSRSSRAPAPGRRVAPRRSPWRLLMRVGALIAVVVAGVLLARGTGSSPPVADTSPGAPVPTMESRDHVPEGTTVEYSTNPPTSGQHWASTAQWGVYTSRPPVDERLVHNLEHGGVIISYNPEQLDAPTIDQLETLADELYRERPCIVLTPRETIQDDKPFALAAWGVLALLDDYDEAAIRAFWRDHVARGPEFGEGRCG